MKMDTNDIHSNNRLATDIGCITATKNSFMYYQLEWCKVKARVAGQCFTIAEATQTFAKRLPLGLNII